MSSAELQSLMSQLQTQRQDPYSHTISAAHSFEIDEHVGRMWWYADGTPGEDEKPGQDTRKMMELTTYDPTKYIDRAHKTPFKLFNNPKSNTDGTIDYSGCTEVDLKLMIEWEKWAKRTALRKVEQKDKKIAKLQKQLEEMKHRHAPGHGNGKGESSMTTTTYPDGRVTVTKGYGKETKAAQEPHKKKRQPKARKANPDLDKQEEIWKKSQEKKRKYCEKKGIPFTPTKFIARTPGVIGKDL